MSDVSLRLISILGFLVVIVLGGLVVDYFRWVRRFRLGLAVAGSGLAVGTILLLNAVLPESNIYGPVITQVNTKQKIVALTFDDGPYPPYTGQILDILKEYNIPATFFVVGKNVEKHPELVKRMDAEGHQIGNHTYRHVDLLKANRAQIIEEIENTDRAIAAVIGKTPHVFRPPHGFRDSIVMQVSSERGLQVVCWSVLSKDWTNPGVNVIVERTLSKVKNGSVILLHDGADISQKASRIQTVEASRLIIRELLSQGYTFVTVDGISK